MTRPQGALVIVPSFSDSFVAPVSDRRSGSRDGFSRYNRTRPAILRETDSRATIQLSTSKAETPAGLRRSEAAPLGLRMFFLGVNSRGFAPR